jgi:hypothetical protein
VLGRFHGSREGCGGVADNPAGALRCADVAGRKSLALLQRRDVEVDRLLREAASREQQLHGGCEPVGRDSQRRRCKRLSENLSAENASMFVRFCPLRAEAPLREARKAQQASDVAAVPFRQEAPGGGVGCLGVQAVHL